jgi:hypothetical protein
MKLRVLVACVAVGALAFLEGCGQREGHGTDRPAEPDRIGFSHAKHAKAQVQCLSCHEEIYDAKNLDTRVLPAEAKCLECHKEKKQSNQCGFCHTDAAHPDTYAKDAPHLHLNHAEHIDRVKEDCAKCHVTLPEPGRPESTPPTMASCTSCHEHKVELTEGQCSPCHTDLKKYALRPVSFFSHEGNFVATHGRSARAAGDSCAQCHEQTFCSDCHAQTVAMKVEAKFPEKVNSDFIHRADYVSRHAIEARADESLCKRCHGETFCNDCHTLQNLTPAAANPRSPHPPNFAFPGAPDWHGPIARRDIASCAACHDQGAQSNCVSCHKVGSVGGDPHPMGWERRHPADEINRNPMCLACHP